MKMYNFKIYQINGLGNKKEVASINAEYFTYGGLGNYEFFRTVKNWYGGVSHVELLSVYRHSNGTSLWIGKNGEVVNI
jgi:hypothetical protein